jgi:hypothetical protein
MSLSRRNPFSLLVPVALVLAVPLGGCALFSQNIRLPPRFSGPEVRIKSFAPPRCKLPADVRTIAVARFGGRSQTDRLWAEQVAVATSRAVAGNLQAFPRHGVVFRGMPGVPLGSRSDGEVSTDAVGELGRAAGADAVVTGNVAAAIRDGREVLAVHFALVRSRDGQVVDRHEHVGRYEDHPAVRRRRSASVTLEALLAADTQAAPRAAAPRPTPQRWLTSRAAARYAERICPHWRSFPVRLASGGGAFGDAGRAAAARGDSMEALLNFRRVTRQDDRDPGAWYNVAVIYEARAEWKQAREHYRRATDRYNIEPFRRGLQRAQREIARLEASTVVKD